MTLLNERQKTKVIFDSDFETIEIDCFIINFSYKNITLNTLPNQKNNFDELSTNSEPTIKIFTTKGILIFTSKIEKLISSKEIVILNNEAIGKIEDTRKTPRYEANCPITIFRPLLGNIDAQLVDISVRGLRFFSETDLDVNSEFELMLNLSESVGKIILTGKILDKTGLPSGIHRMVIEKISNLDRQKLVDYCMSLAK